MDVPTNQPAPAVPATRISLLACSVFEREIALFAGEGTRVVETRFFEMGLHDRPDQLRAVLQEAVDAADARNDIEAIVLAYGLCGLGTAGLHVRRHRLVIPRGHDCITVFLGSKERHAEQQSQCPSCYYYTPGWNRGRRVPGPEKIEALRAELLARFGPDDVDYLLQAERAQWSMHDTATFIDLGTDDAESEADYARRCAEWLGWRYKRLKGDPSLLRDLLNGRWDDAERFQIIEPGCQLAHSPDALILRAEPRVEESREQDCHSD